MKLIGYWFSIPGELDLPLPQHLTVEYDARELRRVSAYLAAGVSFERYRGYSWCRFDCGIAHEEMGSGELTDGTWVWPEGLAHYLERHSVVLPEQFVAHTMKSTRAQGAVPKQSKEPDLRFWKDWAASRGAVPDFRGWERLGANWLSERQIAERMAEALGETDASESLMEQLEVSGLLVNREDRKCLIELPTAELVCVQFSEFSKDNVPKVVNERRLKSICDWPRVGDK